jgi:hypothetical protein
MACGRATPEPSRHFSDEGALSEQGHLAKPGSALCSGDRLLRGLARLAVFLAVGGTGDAGITFFDTAESCGGPNR